MGNRSLYDKSLSLKSIIIYSNAHPINFHLALFRIIRNLSFYYFSNTITYMPLHLNVLQEKTILLRNTIENNDILIFTNSSTKNKFTLYIIQDLIIENQYITLMNSPPKKEKIKKEEPTFSLTITPPLEESCSFQYTCSLGVVCLCTPQPMISKLRRNVEPYHTIKAKSSKILKVNKNESVANKSFDEIYANLLNRKKNF